MKNAVFYRNMWLMPNSTAKSLYDFWKKSGDSKARKKLDDHCKELDRKYQELHYDQKP